jgi:Protein of unknown function (DUF2934)
MRQRNVSSLTLVDDPGPAVTILTFTGAPLASGKGDMDLICGGCGALLIHGQTATDVALQYKVLHLVIKCQCGSYNALSSVPGISSRAAAESDLIPGNQPRHGVDRDKCIAEAAYYRAEKRGFAPGYALEDWLSAEAQVDFELDHSI